MSSDEQTSHEHAAEQPWTIGRLLTWTTNFLRERGSDSASLDAQLLLAHARNCGRIDLFTAYDELASDSLRAEFRELVRRRAAGAPVAYLVGHREFYSLDFEVNPSVLIPRPETEFLVVAVTDLVKRTSDVNASLTIADVGTGSGIVAACLAKHLPHSTVWATDTSQDALEVAQRNCASHNVLERVELRCGDLLDPVPPDTWFDFVVSNPPYVSEAEYAQLETDVREYEPRDALVAGPQGTEVIGRLIPQAAQRLKPGGWLLMEISPMIEQKVRRRLEEDLRFAEPSLVHDLAGHARVVQAAIPL